MTKPNLDDLFRFTIAIGRNMAVLNKILVTMLQEEIAYKKRIYEFLTAADRPEISAEEERRHKNYIKELSDYLDELRLSIKLIDQETTRHIMGNSRGD